jgi:cysteinyl-tRNA synthetase
MIEIIQTLIEKNHAYVAEGSVWFSVRSFKEYGSLSGQKIDEMLTAQDPDKGKKDPHDFALWKAAKKDEPHWNTLWGPGRPGWHIECSAMAQAYLGNQFDIHGGGLDLAFPHHENEVAQSKAAGQQFANYWLHNYWVTQSGEKMSKSLGNTMKVSEILSRFRAIDVRFYLLSAHYRSNLEFSDQALSDAATAFSRIEQFVIRASEKVGEVNLAQELPKAFQEAMDEDIATPSAFAVIHELVTNGNTSISNNDKDLKEIYVKVRTMLDVLGLDPLNKQWQKETSQDATNALDSLIQTMLKQRNDARASKNFEVADSVRDALNSAGILIEDTPQGSRWTINKETK